MAIGGIGVVGAGVMGSEIEAVSEVMATKQAVFRVIDEVLAPWV